MNSWSLFSSDGMQDVQKMIRLTTIGKPSTEETVQRAGASSTGTQPHSVSGATQWVVRVAREMSVLTWAGSVLCGVVERFWGRWLIRLRGLSPAAGRE